MSTPEREGTLLRSVAFKKWL